MPTRCYSACSATLVFLLSAGAALACPVASDLDTTGIRFIAADGSAEIQRRMDAERIEVDYVVPGEPDISRSIAIHGTFLHWYGTIQSNGSLQRGSTGWVVRRMDLSEVPVPAAGGTWTASQTFFEEGGSKTEEQISVSVGAETTWVLGACNYTALPVAITITTADSTYTDHVTYVPELGTGVLTGFTDSEGSGTYHYVDIAVEPAR